MASKVGKIETGYERKWVVSKVGRITLVWLTGLDDVQNTDPLSQTGGKSDWVFMFS